MTQKIKGTLKLKNKEVIKSEKFKFREFVVEDNAGRYPEYYTLRFTQERCDQLDTFNIGDQLEVDYKLQGREWKSPEGELKYFNTLEAQTIKKTNQ